MMNYAYSEIYLSDALMNMGEFIEFASENHPESVDEILHSFIISGYASRWDKGDPRVLSGMSGTELYFAVQRACGLACDEDKIKALTRYDTGPAYWCGYILAYFHFRSRHPFSEIINTIDYDYLLSVYPAFHTASDEKCFVEISRYFNAAYSQTSRLQAYRKMIGMTQRQLAEESGVNLRTLQQYEIGDKDIKKAAAEKVLSLSDVLHVSPEALLS